MPRWGMVMLGLFTFAGAFASLYVLALFTIPDGNSDLIGMLVGAFATGISSITTAAIRIRTGDRQ
jgi:hypothetical protein